MDTNRCETTVREAINNLLGVAEPTHLDKSSDSSGKGFAELLKTGCKPLVTSVIPRDDFPLLIQIYIDPESGHLYIVVGAYRCPYTPNIEQCVTLWSCQTLNREVMVESIQDLRDMIAENSWTHLPPRINPSRMMEVLVDSFYNFVVLNAAVLGNPDREPDRFVYRIPELNQCQYYHGGVFRCRRLRALGSEYCGCCQNTSK